MVTVLSTEDRKARLQQILDTGSTVGRQRLFYKDENRDFSVYRIDLDLLIYNRHNGRIEAEMLTWEQENQALDEYDDALDKLIDNLLWDSSEARNKATLEDLAKKDQQRPAIVTLDGVIIDGNRRAMLLRRLAARDHSHKYLTAIILEDAYADNEQEIVRLETQYQLGEDAKVEYGALQKYLHAKRLHLHLGIGLEEIDALMNREEGYAERLLAIMEMMDRYLAHIGCPGMYTMLKDDSDGTKEGLFVDLHNDLKRLRSSNPRVDWPISDVERNDLEAIQFDFIRLGSLDAGNKQYRQISHQGKKRNFFAHQEMWDAFSTEHHQSVDPVTIELPTLEQYIAANPHHDSKTKAARARERAWCEAVEASMNSNFAANEETLTYKVQHLAPREYLAKALRALQQIDIAAHGLTSDGSNVALLEEIDGLIEGMKARFAAT